MKDSDLHCLQTTSAFLVVRYETTSQRHANNIELPVIPYMRYKPMYTFSHRVILLLHFAKFVHFDSSFCIGFP